MDAKVEVLFITNSTSSAPSVGFARRALESLRDTFPDAMSCTVHLAGDPNPNRAAYNEYMEALEACVHAVGFRSAVKHKTSGLCDAYVSVIPKLTRPYLFMLEHDWTFHNAVISSTLLALVKCMDEHEEVGSIRFNKRRNVTSRWDLRLVPVRYSGIPLCASHSGSNQQQLLRRENAVRYRIPLCDTGARGSCGVEEKITRRIHDDPSAYVAMGCHVYGPPDYCATIHHMDGKHFVDADGEGKPRFHEAVSILESIPSTIQAWAAGHFSHDDAVAAVARVFPLLRRRGRNAMIALLERPTRKLWRAAIKTVEAHQVIVREMIEKQEFVPSVKEGKDGEGGEEGGAEERKDDA